MKIKDAKWKPLDNAIGMKPKIPITCGVCFRAAIRKEYTRLCADDDDVGTHLLLIAFERTLKKLVDGKFDMVLRETFCSPVVAVGERAYHNDMHYKCAYSDGCDQVKVFGVPIDKEYYQWLLQKRKGEKRIIPWEQWDEEEDIMNQLIGMGYI